MTINQVKVFINGHQVIITKVHIYMIKEMVMVKCTEMMDLVIKDNGKMEFNMGKVK